MLRLHKAVIIRPYVSENIKKYVCCHVQFYFYIIWHIWPEDGYFVQPQCVAAIRCAIIKLACRQTTSFWLRVLLAQRASHTLRLNTVTVLGFITWSVKIQSREIIIKAVRPGFELCDLRTEISTTTEYLNPAENYTHQRKVRYFWPERPI
jgi:hypothetical protein